MAEFTLGQAACVNTGAYNANATYAPLNTVYYNGGTWVALKSTTGTTPGTDATAWLCITQGIRSINVAAGAEGFATLTITLTDGTTASSNIPVGAVGDGTITAETAKAADASGTPEGGETPASASYKFTNAYDADGTLKLDAEKVFKNGTLHGGEFTFKLMDADGEELQSKTNDAAGNVSFNLITYSMKDLKNSPFTYTVMEVPGSRTDVKYDATVYTVTVELKDNGDGTLEVTKTVDNGGELKFVNEQLNVETTVTIGGEKVLKGRKLKEGEFKFVLADENGKWVDTATNDASGNFTFKPITYKLFDLKGEKSKVYTYGISEVK